MSLKNTEEKQKIIKRNVSLKQVVATGIILFSLATVAISFDRSDSEIVDSEEHGYYSERYLENLRTTNPADYDSDFGQIYNNVTFSCNGKTYPGSSIYIVSYDDGLVHLIDSDNRKTDLITNESINAKRTGIALFKESSIFYELYKANIITNEQVELTPNYLDIIKTWDGEKHYQTVDLVVEQKTEEEYHKKYGGK